jgi:hypothetical protein
MKKLIPILAALGLVLGVGLAFADEYAPLGYAGRDNGVTFFGTVDTSIGAECTSEGGMGAGGMAEEGATKDVLNIKIGGIEYMSPNGVSFSSESAIPNCAWAPGLGRDLELHNGVTVPGV